MEYVTSDILKKRNPKT